ncbi:MAG: DUF2135 domain-containing protein [Bacteroidales bacterium]|jgi:hypothetical protein|nr:DUF2135 domain-containing protein [Bacteroidales bacterium]
MKTRSLNLAICMLMTASGLYAQAPTMSIGGKKGSTEVYLQTLDVQVEVTGNIASTKFTLTFKNRTKRILEGELLFPLPDGVTVSHYALDINGKMRDAVPVEKAKATQVFEEIEQRRIDPGLLERVEGNNFRTRIYPIPANGTRTIAIGYEQELSSDHHLLRYRLPMDYREAIDHFSLKATVWQSSQAPRIDGKADELRFDAQGANFVSSFSRKNYLPSKLLAFSLPAPADVPQVFVQPASGSWYFMASCYPKAEQRRKQWSDRLGIIWDASLSGLHRDTKNELELLDRIIREKKDLTVTLFLLNNRFANAGTFAIKGGDWSALRNVLEKVDYDGGTNFRAVELHSTVQEFLFFSDGLSTLSEAELATNPDKPVHCIVSSSRADYSALKWIAAQTGGKFVNLNVMTQDEAQNELMNETLCFLGTKKPGTVREVYPSAITPVSGNFSVSGILDAAQAEITLLFGYGNKMSIEKRIKIDTRNAAGQGNIHRMWAQKKINELDLRYEKNREELIELGEQFGIVTRNTSLIVLETLQDYITYRITPPAELRAEYSRWQKGQAEQARQDRQDLLAQAKTAATMLKQWWETDFKPVKQKYPKPDNDSRRTEGAPLLPDSHAVQLEIVEMEEAGDRMSKEATLDEVVVVGFGTQRRATVIGSASRPDMSEERETANRKQAAPDKPRTPAAPQPVIKLTPMKQDNKYMKALTGRTDADYSEYLRLRKDYFSTPAFYFDMADWFFRHNDRTRALRILTSISDMELENASLYRLLGYRLKEYAEYELEAYVCRKVIQWRPMEPQSYRDYALALADAGHYRQALDTLYSALTQSYARNIGQRSLGIEEVMVTELNRLITANRQLNAPAINKELVKSMPVDVRVVINWNMNSTDIDLHVTDPNGETCFYSHKATAIGGRISQDITQGYGPEQFMLKKAVKGKYKVYVNYFGDSQVKAEGPSTIMVEIYTGYSGNSQQRQVICLQMSKKAKPAGNGLIQVAEFEF